jgi:hypothetical protein
MTTSPAIRLCRRETTNTSKTGRKSFSRVIFLDKFKIRKLHMGKRKEFRPKLPRPKASLTRPAIKPKSKGQPEKLILRLIKTRLTKTRSGFILKKAK